LAVEHRVIDTELPVLTALASEPDVGDPGPERAVTAEVVPAAHDVAPVAQEPAYEEVVVVEPEPEPEPEPEGDPPPPPEDTQQPKQPDRDRPAAAKPEVDVGALLHRAEEARAHGDGKRAAALFEDVLRHRPRNLGALKGLSKLAFNRGDHKAAIGYLRRAVKVAPRDGDLRIRLGDAHYKLGQYTQARTHFTKAAENGHPSARRRLDLLQDAAGS
jgi:tetratricopeptide (TPR) repeat protein